MGTTGDRDGAGTDDRERRLSPVTHAVLVLLPLLVAVVGACSSASDDDADGLGGSTAATGAGAGGATTTAAVEDIELQADDFVRLQDMTPVRGFFVDNRLGHLDEALAVANDTEGGGAYPVGTIIQLIPQEAMVKRAPGFDARSNDWEFFSLAVSESGTEILSRGGADVINQFGGSCADCHAAAEPQFDFVCEDGHGCEPLPIGDDVIRSVQASDPRPPSTP
jgi:hypothetical protein